MSNNSALGRHRAARTHASGLTAISGAVSSNAGSVGRQAAVIVAATGLILTAGLPAHGIGESERVVLSTPLNAAAVTVDEVSAPATAKITFERAAVKATPAPVKTAPVVEAKAKAVEVVEAVAPAAPVVEPVQAVPAVAVQPAVQESAPVEAPVEEAPAPAPAPVAPAPAAAAPAPAAPKAEAPKAKAPAAPSSNIAAGLVGSAYSQIGVAQDCTAMVEKALRSVGKSVGDIAPSGFFAFGSVVGSPAAGDLVITGGHVAIYVGNGQVISGGLNGMNTGLHSLSDLPGASFVRVS